MSVMHSARKLDDQFHRTPIWHGLLFDDFIKSSTFHQLHAEVAGTVAFPDLMDRDDTWVVQTRCGLRLKPKPFDVRFGGPPSGADDFQGDYAVKAFLTRAIDQALAAATNLLQQLVVAQFFRQLHAACSTNFAVEHSKTRLQKARCAKSFRFVHQNC